VLPFFGFVLAALQEINSKGFSPTGNLPFERQTNIYYWSIPHMTRIWQRAKLAEKSRQFALALDRFWHLTDNPTASEFVSFSPYQSTLLSR
jgi:hypothetical protein